jgi:acetyl esterase
MSPAAARKLVDDFAPFWNEGAPDIRTADRTVPGPLGPIPIRLYDPGAPASAPGLVFFHGGGWVLCNIGVYDGVCRRLAQYGGFPVVSVDYRLAPEHKFPAPLEDCLAALRWVAGHGAELGIDGARLAIAGDSAGGNLSLAAAMSLRDNGGPPLKGAALIYGAYGVDFDTPSYQAYGTDDYLLSRADMIWFWNHYLRGDSDRRNPLAVPLAGTFQGLPPLLVTAAEFDPLLDDSRRLVDRLQAAGATHDWAFWPGVVHGCIDMAKLLEPAERFLRETAAWIGRRLRD